MLIKITDLFISFLLINIFNALPYLNFHNILFLFG